MRKHVAVFFALSWMLASVLWAQEDIPWLGLIDESIPESRALERLRTQDYPLFPDGPILGWSPNGRIAFIQHYSPTGPIGTLQRFVVQDLVDDRVLFRLELDNNADPEQALREIRKTLAANRIVYRPSNTEPFPMIQSETILAAYTVQDKLILRRHPGEHWKTAAQIDSRRFSLNGFAKSPFENRIAIAYSMGPGRELRGGQAEFEAYNSFIGSHLGIGFQLPGTSDEPPPAPAESLQRSRIPTVTDYLGLLDLSLSYEEVEYLKGGRVPAEHSSNPLIGWSNRGEAAFVRTVRNKTWTEEKIAIASDGSLMIRNTLKSRGRVHYESIHAIRELLAEHTIVYTPKPDTGGNPPALYELSSLVSLVGIEHIEAALFYDLRNELSPSRPHKIDFSQLTLAQPLTGGTHTQWLLVPFSYRIGDDFELRSCLWFSLEDQQ